MKKFTCIFLSIFCIISCFPQMVSAQGDQPGEWIRVQSDNGEFSIEVPAEYNFYGDKDGFLISDYSQSYQLSEMRMLNAYHDKTLLSFEAYKTASPKTVADIFVERDEKNGKESKIKLGETKIRQILIQNKAFYAVRRFYASENHLYVLTAASRNGETPVIKRFLDSLALKTADAKSAAAATTDDSKVKIIRFAALKLSQIEIDQDPAPLKKPGDQKTLPAPTAPDANALPIALIARPNPSFTDAARQKGVQGTVRVRLTFSKNGSITKINFLSTLKEGLLRQVMFAAIRMKYIPAEKNGEPSTVTKLVEYKFDIY